MSERDYAEGFKVGVCCALAIVAAFDDEVQWREIVAACGGYRKLHAFSKAHGNLDTDGFSHYRAPLRPRRHP